MRERTSAGSGGWPGRLRDLMWMMALAALLVLSSMDVGTHDQLVLSSSCFVILVFLRVLGLAERFRYLTIAIASFVTLRYVGWRVTQTLPDTASWGFVPGVLLLVAEAYGILMFLLGTFVNVRPLEREDAAPAVDPGRLPTVDVLVPSYNEPIALLERTLIAATMIRYPQDKLNVFLLDDGGTDQKCNDANVAAANAARARRTELEAACAEIGVTYLTRARNEHAKAGNINAALTHCTGELVMILDADHVPTQDFLEMTAGHFVQKPRLFLVQTPHFFINPDPIERNLGTFSRMPSENEMFYCVGQKGLDFWNAAFFCGSAALLRRRCLDEVGGIQTTTITEDAHTALELHARGYESLYVARPMVAGLQPETFTSFIGQRTRWAQGMMQILLMRNPVLKRGLHLSQRLCYLSSSIFWLFPIIRMLFLLMPLTYLVFGIAIFNSSFEEFLAYAAPHVATSLIVTNFLFGRVRWPFISEIYECAQALFISPAILSVFVNPKKPTFKVTAKDETLETNFVSQLAPAVAILLGVLTVATIFGLWRWEAYPLERGSLAIVLGFNIVNMIFVGAALGATYEQRQVRSQPRVPLELPFELDVLGERLSARSIDISATGARLLLNRDVPLSGLREAILRIDLPERGIKGELLAEVRYEGGNDRERLLGVRFVPRSLAERRLVVGLLYGSSDTWLAFQARRQGGRSLIGGLIHVFLLAVLRGGKALLALIEGSRRGVHVGKPVARPAAPSPRR